MLVFTSTLVLKGHKLSRNFGSVVILGFMPSHKLVLESLDDLSLVLTEELGLGVHN